MLRWGLLGTAKINEKAIEVLKASKTNSLAAIASRSKEKAESYAKEHGIPVAFGSYESMLESSEVDAIYLSLPNSLHFEWAKRALAAGKHVLCEKPMVMNGDEAAELKSAAEKAGRHLTEGFMYRHTLQTQELKKLVTSGRYGELRHLHGDFHFHLSDSNNVRLRKEEGGGTLGDLGCYLIDLIQFLFGQAPVKVSGTSEIGPTGVDIDSSALLDFGNGRSATFACSFKATRRDELTMTFSNATVYVPHPFKPTSLERLKVVTADSETVIEIRDNETAFARQFENFSAVVRGEAQPLVTLEESVRMSRTMEALRK
jgi:D-xylose 1-dehydrogenase (NADP+, D-xylono-1,5-lactone-forming)